MTSLSERRQLVQDFILTERPFPDQLCIQELFEQRVQLQPGDTAVETDELRLSYAELEARANQLAHLLLERGAGAKQPIAVCLGRSADLVVALLAVAKAGCPYVPLDPSCPPERLRTILKESSALLVVTSTALASAFDCSVLQLDGQDAERLACMPTLRPNRDTVSTDVCYVMFTSGTTGSPKGVVLTHRAVVNTLDWVNRTFEVGPGDRLLFVNSPCFDLSVYDVFGALGSGATLVVANEALLADPIALARSIVSRQITIWNSAPAVLQQLVEFLPDTQAAQLRLVLLSGDWIPLTLPVALQRFRGVQVISLGGATEAAIWSNWFAIEQVDATWTSIPYGKPIQNARYYVLNEQLEPLPIGAKGDLYIGGACLAEGYLNRPELTAERFIADPFCEGQRLYKTGDLAWHRADGNLELLGRSDFQVKIRGYRVELAELEAAVRALPGVTQVVCEARKDASGEKALVAHIVNEPGSGLVERDIRAGLARTLPAYMLPSRIIFRAALPLSSNGKIDRQRLSSENDDSPQIAITVPNSGTEQELAQLWEQLLGRRVIRFDENFFEIGGHSLLAVLLVARIRERLGVEVSLAQVIESPTIERLARSIEGLASLTPSSQHLHSYHVSGTRTPLLLIPGVLGTVFTFRGLPTLLGPDQPLHVVDFLNERSRSAGSFSSVEAIAEYLEPEVIPLLTNGTAVLGGFSFGASVAFELAARLRSKGYHIPLLISFDGQAPGFPKKLPLGQRLMALGRSLAEGDEEVPLPELIAKVGDRIKRWVQPELPVTAPTIQVMDPELQRHIECVAQAQLKASALYAPQDVQQLDLLLLKAQASAQTCGSHGSAEDYGWRHFIDGAISSVTVPGEHLNLFDDAKLPTLASVIAERIDQISKTALAFPSQRRTLTSLAPTEVSV